MRVVVGILPAAGRLGKVVCMRLERGVCPRALSLTALGGRFTTVAVVCTPGGEGMRTPVVCGAVAGQDRVAMQIERARLLAKRLHADDYEEDGTALLESTSGGSCAAWTRTCGSWPGCTRS
jgi:hypothetical protein